MAKKKDKKIKPNYVARESAWVRINWLLLLLIFGGGGAFAYLQFVYMPNAEGEMVDTLGIVAAVCLATAIVAFLWQFIRIILAIRHRFEFYDDRVVEKMGILSTNETQGVFIGIYVVNVRQGLLGKIFNFGDVVVDYPGYWDLATKGIYNPHRLKRYLETRMTKKSLNAIITN